MTLAPCALCATAIAFALRGWAVALLARCGPGREGARQDVETAGGEALVITVDVADAAATVFAVSTSRAADATAVVAGSAIATPRGGEAQKASWIGILPRPPFS